MSINLSMAETENQVDTEVETPMKGKKKKETIPIAVKNALWSEYFQNNINGICQCCKTEIISKNNFDCGHIISEKEGGTVSLTNLKPICRACNCSMGTLNMEVFIKKYGFDKIGQIANNTTETKTETKKDTETEKRNKEEMKFLKDTEKLEKQFKETMEKANKLQKEAEEAMEIAKKNQTEYMNIYNQLLGKCKNDELKKMCQTLKMSKTVYSNKEEYLKSIFDYLNEKTSNDLKDLNKELNLKGSNMMSIIYYLSKNN
jgi:hypothetical protein